MAAGAPILHVLAGPNGAGKTTLYEARVRQLAKAPFVNADQLSFEALGRHAETREEAELGQRLANVRRDALMAAGESLVTESTFSHPSKLELIRQAKALGYRVAVYHVNLISADAAVARVAARQALGGHPVPEANVRGRYERNQPLSLPANSRRSAISSSGNRRRMAARIRPPTSSMTSRWSWRRRSAATGPTRTSRSSSVSSWPKDQAASGGGRQAYWRSFWPRCAPAACSDASR